MSNQIINAYLKAAKEDKIKAGQICEFNYGEAASDHGYFIYIGNGVFVKYDEMGPIDEKNIYYPDGFKRGVAYRIVKA